VEAWLKELDRIPTEGSKLSVYVYYVQNGKAKDVAEVLKQIYAPVKDKKTETKSATTTTPATRPAQPTPARGAAAAKEEAAAATSFMEGELNIVVDETTNALVIRAYQRDYNAIVETIKKLDLYPKQALIEVFLAEVTLDDETQLGLEFAAWQDGFRSGDRTFNYSLAAGGSLFGTPLSLVPSSLTGLRYAIDSTNKLFAAVRANAVDGRVRVLTSPHILASNNKEAKIQIGTSQPILSNTFTTPGASAVSGTTSLSSGIVEGTIEYKDIGTIVSVTPRISDGGLVTMEINVEDSTVILQALGNLSNIPAFPKKTAKTTLSIMEGQTIVIGGLMGERKEVHNSGIPFLSKIPILGSLFGTQQYIKRKTETILLLTPHVISNLEQSNHITQEFREKLGGIKRELASKEKDDAQQSKKPDAESIPAPKSDPSKSP
jgi:general secretion pathway protein D